MKRFVESRMVFVDHFKVIVYHVWLIVYQFKAVVLKLFCMFYPFNKDDYQIYPQYIK